MIRGKQGRESLPFSGEREAVLTASGIIYLANAGLLRRPAENTGRKTSLDAVAEETPSPLSAETAP